MTGSVDHGQSVRFVLVHGAWHGAWCWGAVAAALRAAGHEVRTPTLAGLGERAAEASREVGLRTHVEDVVAALDRPGTVLVGHSYAGLVVREAADCAPDRVRGVVLVDGWAGPSGASLFGLAPPWFADGLRTAAHERGEGWLLPAIAPALVGVDDPEQAAALEAQLTPHPLRTFEDATNLGGAVDRLPGCAILCCPSGGLPFEEMARTIGYTTLELESGHDAMVLEPDALAALLLVAAASLGVEEARA